jgi:antitoxin HicB
MNQMSYPARLSSEKEGGFTVVFVDLPEAITSGTDRQDALVQAADCLHEALAGRVARRESVPAPSQPKRGQALVSVPLEFAPKLALYQAMREQAVTNMELARRLGVTETVVRRMLDPRHATHPARMQRALLSLGIRVSVHVEAA